MSTCPEKRPLLPLALLFLRIGIMGFGGALANMALMEQACVKQHKWLTQAQYLEGVALSYLLPGPTAVLLSIYLGSRRRGLVGGVISGLSFIAPAVVLTFAFCGSISSTTPFLRSLRYLRDLTRSSSPSSWRCSIALGKQL